MAIICPSVTANDPHQYREQIERIESFAKRIHLDFMDGEFAPTESPPIESAWWPDRVTADVHIMYARPQDHLAKIIHLKPNLVVIHAEAEGHVQGIATTLHQAGIKIGVALLAKTPVSIVKADIKHIDHVLVFSGNLGYYGGKADLSLLDKVKQLRRLKKGLEIGWDGGINADNVASLVHGGVDVLNVGGFIQRAEQPSVAYATLETLAGKQI